MAPLKHTAACRANKVPLKRGILLEGKYGTGKSLTARVTAKVATDHGWTFIMLNRSQGLKQAIEFARAYQPCVIFAEDIDRAADRENEDVNDLVNLLDGLITKNMEMMVVLTTNFIDKIDRSLLRPGRFDAVISIDAPDAETSAKIVRAYAGPLLAADADLTEVGETTAGMIPASIREVVERAKLGMLTEGRDNIAPNDLLASALGMQRHMALLNPAVETKSLGEAFADSLMDLLGDTLAERIEGAAGDGSVRHTETMTRLNKALLLLSKSQDYLGAIHKNAAAGAQSAQAANEKAEVILARV
jgi:SpoVK/Ycf46/Vps4 family AAA+-type ATPase